MVQNHQRGGPSWSSKRHICKISMKVFRLRWFFVWRKGIVRLFLKAEACQLSNRFLKMFLWIFAISDALRSWISGWYISANMRLITFIQRFATQTRMTHQWWKHRKNKNVTEENLGNFGGPNILVVKIFGGQNIWADKTFRQTRCSAQSQIFGTFVRRSFVL